jgi:hypothetical protein
MFKLKDEAYIQLYTAIFMVLSAFSGGYGVANVDHTPLSEDITKSYVDEAQTFDIFSSKATEVSTLMNKTLSNPTEYNLRSANNQLAVIEWRWLSNNDGKNKELFSEYLNECQKVIDDLQENGEAYPSNMKELYSELVPSSKESPNENVKMNEQTPFLWVN